MGVSQKWMVYNGKTLLKWDDLEVFPIFLVQHPNSASAKLRCNESEVKCFRSDRLDRKLPVDEVRA